MAAAYSASKAAVIAMTKAIGKDLARTGRRRQLRRSGGDRDAHPRRRVARARRVHGRAHSDGSDGEGGGGCRARLLARERGVLVLDRRDVRHLRRAGGVLMRRVRLEGPAGIEAGTVEGDSVLMDSGERVALRDPDRVEPEAPYRLVLPLEPPEVWCAGVTYRRSRDARIEESVAQDVYSLVYDAERPELFLKDAGCRRTVGPGEPIGVRSDSSWDVPEPEIGLVLGKRRLDRGRHDRQRRVLARDRGSEPAVPPAGEGLRGRVRARPGGADLRCPRSRSRSGCASSGRTTTCSSRARPRPRG